MCSGCLASPSMATKRATTTTDTAPIGGSKVTFTLAGDPRRAHRSRWRATLEIKVKDLPQLMAEGLHISCENVDIKRNCILYNPAIESSPYKKGKWTWPWPYKRQYWVADNNRHDPEWRGQLSVYARTLTEISEFRIEQVSFDKVDTALALNMDGMPAYTFHLNKSHMNFNAILDDYPLSGLWPWPRNNAGVGEVEVSQDWPDEWNSFRREVMVEVSEEWPDEWNSLRDRGGMVEVSEETEWPDEWNSFRSGMVEVSEETEWPDEWNSFGGGGALS